MKDGGGRLQHYKMAYLCFPEEEKVHVYHLSVIQIQEKKIINTLNCD